MIQTDSHYAHRKFLCEKAFQRWVVGMIDADHLARVLHEAARWTGGPPGIDDVNTIVAATAKAWR